MQKINEKNKVVMVILNMFKLKLKKNKKMKNLSNNRIKIVNYRKIIIK